MKLKTSYDAMSDVPAGFEGAYTEQNGLFVLTGGDFEFKSEAEFSEVQKAKQAGFDQLHELKSQMKAFEGIDTKAYKSMQEELDVLRAKAKDGGSDEETIKAIVDMRVARATEELTKQNQELSEQLEGANGKVLQTEKKTMLNDILGKHVSSEARADAEFIIGSAIEREADGTYVSNGAAGFEKGLPVESLITKALETRTHWKKQNTPGHGAEGSRGGGVTNASRFTSLLQKQTEGRLTRAETNELETIATEMKTEQKQ